MIEYILAHNPDDRIIKKAAVSLLKGDIIATPSDTSWLMLACISSKPGVEKLYRIKKENDKEKHFSIIVDSISMAQELAQIDNPTFKFLKKHTPGHYTFILESKQRTNKLLQATKRDHQIGLRIPPVVWVERIVSELGQGLVTTNITNELIDISPDEELFSYQIEDKLSHCLSMIVDPGEFEFAGQSTVIDFSQGTGPMLVRAGAGDSSMLP